MKFHSFRPRLFAMVIASFITTAAAMELIDTPSVDILQDGDGIGVGGNRNAAFNNAKTLYIVRFQEQALAQYDGTISGLNAAPRQARTNRHSKLMVNSIEASTYVAYLQNRQAAHLNMMQGLLGHRISIRHQMQYALNAVIVELTPAEAKAVAKMSTVVAVDRDRHFAPTTDIAPSFIGASHLWWDQFATQDTLFITGFEVTHGYRGEGLVIGVIDTGYNSLSPSFAAIDETGYVFQNPLGAGVYLGQCHVNSISKAGCNSKVIGVYDEINAGPLLTVEDIQNHGSHTASTLAGNSRSATLNGYQIHISGVAPRANLVIFYACSPDPNVRCSTSATSMAVEHAIQGGVVNALNYSIAGGTEPWNDPTSQAFLSATNAGIFIAAAGGNTTPAAPIQAPGTVMHWEPWVTTVAAGTDTGGPILLTLSVTGPGSVPTNTQNIPLIEAISDTALIASIAGTTSIKLSPQFHNSDTSGSDGCAAYPGATFTNDIALISRSGCAFTTQVANAYAAGALAVIISDNQIEGPFIPDLSSQSASIPVYSVLQGDGTNLQNFLAAHANVGTAQIPYPPSRLPQQPDVLAGFSLLGPAGLNVIKPEVQAPGVNVLAALANNNLANGPNLVGVRNGTSMATPHIVGAATLLLGLHPDWTPMEVKSALMMTAQEVGLTKADAMTPSDFYDRGSGRIQVDIANNAGLVMNETGQRFKMANPAKGGDPRTLNLPSMQNLTCFTGAGAQCDFQRTLRSTQSQPVTWSISMTGAMSPHITVTPSSFTVAAGAYQSLQIHVNASTLLADGNANFGAIALTPNVAGLPSLHLPIAVAVP